MTSRNGIFFMVSIFFFSTLSCIHEGTCVSSTLHIEVEAEGEDGGEGEGKEAEGEG